MASQYDPNSPNFHQWLTPEQVGENFGPSQTDIATITNWLHGHGFTVNQVTNDRMSIRFSGTAAQVESAFHTEIHNLEVKGEQHIGNMSDPQIPAALAPVVVGVKSLHNFFPRPLHQLGSLVTQATQPANGSASPARRPRLESERQPQVQCGRRVTALLRRQSTAAQRSRPQFGISVGRLLPLPGGRYGALRLCHHLQRSSAVECEHHRWNRADDRHRRNQRASRWATDCGARLQRHGHFLHVSDLPTASAANTPTAFPATASLSPFAPATS